MRERTKQTYIVTVNMLILELSSTGKVNPLSIQLNPDSDISELVCSMQGYIIKYVWMDAIQSVGPDGFPPNRVVCGRNVTNSNLHILVQRWRRSRPLIDQIRSCGCVKRCATY